MTAASLQRVAPLSNPTNARFTHFELQRPCGARMKGFPLLHLIQLMDTKGPDVAATWRATLPKDVAPQTEKKNLTSVSWIPVEHYFHGVDWLARTHFGGVRGALEVGHFTATQDIGAFFRMAISFTSPTTVLGLSGRFWKSYFDVSSLHVVKSSANGCTAEVRDWPLRDKVSLHEMTGSLIAWMEASRAKDVTVHRFELTKPGLLTLEVTWS